MKIFVNEAINNGIFNYLNYVNNKPLNNENVYEFFVIKVLICIFGEINIVNPYKLGKEESFKSNLLLFGSNKKEVELFIKLMDDYNKWLHSPTVVKKTNIPNKISAILINMILLKSLKQEISDKDIALFDSFFAPIDGDMFKIQNLIIDDKKETPKLWHRKRGQLVGSLNLEIIPPDLLSANDYVRYGLSLTEVKQLSNLKIREINAKIQTEDAETNEGGKDKFDPKKLILTSGSGFVDTVVLLSIMATEIMIGLLIAFWFLRR